MEGLSISLPKIMCGRSRVIITGVKMSVEQEVKVRK